MSWFLTLSYLFTAGSIGGLVNALVVWFFGYKGINQFLGVQIFPKMTTTYLYSKIIWGGLWGLLFVVVTKGNLLFYYAGLISIVPTLVQLFYVFPKQDVGPAGLKLGKLTPYLVIVFNLVWAYTAATWIYFIN